jgi:hypothetical protein
MSNRERRSLRYRRWQGGRACLKLAGVALSGLGFSLSPALAHAGSCVQIDEQRDGLAPEDRNSARTLFEDALTEEHQEVSREGCTDTWTLYHVRLGESLTAVVQTSRGTRRDRVKRIEDLPGLYSQMVRSLISGAQMTNESTSMTRKNVTESQMQPQRVRADAIWYAKLGYGSTTADGFHSGPQFGFGRRWELDRVGIDLGFFNFLMYQTSDNFEGLSAGWVELAADYFFDAFGNSSPYVGAGLSLGSHSIPSTTGDFDGSGLQGKATLGYEMFRASTIRLLAQFDAILPLYRLARRTSDGAGVEATSHTYSPNLMLSLGLGWGGSAD